MSNTLKRQVLPAGLWVVATPIGNLEDLAPRARQALEEADAILCEDTRRTSQLMAALGISKRLERLDAHATSNRIETIVERLSQGESLALVSDAGTPAISDPGALLVARAQAQGIQVTPFPGPSAVVTLLSAAGFHETPFVFRGFFPRKQGERADELALIHDAAAKGLAKVFVWFESPERITQVLNLIAEKEPVSRVVAAKELTKLHEKLFAGSAAATAAAVEAEIQEQGARGEWCLAVCLEVSPQSAAESSDWVKALQCLLNVQVSASVAAKQVSQSFGVSRNDVYEMALRLSGKKSEEGG